MGLAGIKGSRRGTEDTEGIIGGLTDIFTQRRRGRGGFFRTAEKFSHGGHGDTETFFDGRLWKFHTEARRTQRGSRRARERDYILEGKITQRRRGRGGIFSG